jgi:hypothetical protein
VPAFTVFKTDQGATPKDTPDTGSEKDVRSKQIDELCRLSEDARREIYGTDHDTECRNFYNLIERTRRTPTFRPRISVPQLQVLLLSDAADLTDASVRVFINHKTSGRDKQREKAFQEHWRQENFNFHLLLSQVYSEFSGTSFLQAGYDPLAKRGEGSAWLRARQQQGTYIDPISWFPDDWSFVVTEDPIYLDEVWRRYPDHAEDIHPRTAKAEALAGPPAGGIEMPPGPMSVTIRGLPGSESYTSDGALRLRTMYCKDSTLRSLTEAEKAEFQKKDLAVPRYLMKYPKGRMIVECEGTILVDGDSWINVYEMWPIVPVWSTPPWDSVWCPSPVKYTRSLQDNAEKLMSQTYENAHRLNNGLVQIPEESGITADSFGGLPGEMVVLASNTQRAITVSYPNPMPPQMIQLPIQYLQLQRELQGQSQARQGNPGAGNVGADLFEAAISQSQSITKLRARLFSYSVQRVSEVLFYTMSRFYDKERVFYSNRRVQDAKKEAKPDEDAQE